MSLLWY